MGDALVLALLPALLGFLVGRWWLLLIGALVATTTVGRLVGHDVDTGPVAVLLVVPLAGCAAGVALRRLVAPPSEDARSPRRAG